MPSVIALLFIMLLQHRCWANPVLDEPSEIFDLDPDSISKESLDPNVYLNSVGSSQPGSGLSLFESSAQSNDLIAFDGSGLAAGVDDNCPPNNGQSRKRNSMTCPATGSTGSPSFGIFGDYNEEELDSLEEDPRDLNICSEIFFFFGRVFDVCCNGPYGPYVIDEDVRLIYSWISDCRLGMSEPYVIALICVLMHKIDNNLICRWLYSLSNSDQCLLSIFYRKLISKKSIVLPIMAWCDSTRSHFLWTTSEMTCTNDCLCSRSRSRA